MRTPRSVRKADPGSASRAPVQPAAAGASRLNRGLVIFVLAALTAFAPMSIDMYLPALPALARDLGASDAGAQFTVSAFFLGFAGGQLLYGPLADRFGRRAPLLAGVALFIAATAGCAAAGSLGSLIAFRLLEGFGGGAGPVLARAIVRDLYGGNRAARVLSIMVLVMAVAPLVAPLIGGQVLLVWGWRAIFWILAAFGVASAAAVLVLLSETLPAERRLRGPALSLLLGYGVPLRDRRYLGFAVGGGLVYGGMFAYITGTPFVFITLYGVPPERFGLLFGANVLGIMIAATVNGWIVMRFGAHRLFSLGVLASALAGSALVIVAMVGCGGLPALFVPLFLFIASIGFVGANGVACCLGRFPDRAGTASALAGTLQFLLGAACGSLVGLLADGTARPMAAVIAASGLAAFAIQRWLAPYRAGADHGGRPPVPA